MAPPFLPWCSLIAHAHPVAWSCPCPSWGDIGLHLFQQLRVLQHEPRVHCCTEQQEHYNVLFHNGRGFKWHSFLFNIQYSLILLGFHLRVKILKKYLPKILTSLSGSFSYSSLISFPLVYILDFQTMFYSTKIKKKKSEKHQWPL